MRPEDGEAVPLAQFAALDLDEPSRHLEPAMAGGREGMSIRSPGAISARRMRKSWLIAAACSPPALAPR